MSQNGAFEIAGLHMNTDIYLFQYQYTNTKFEYTGSGMQIGHKANNRILQVSKNYEIRFEKLLPHQ